MNRRRLSDDDRAWQEVKDYNDSFDDDFAEDELIVVQRALGVFFVMVLVGLAFIIAARMGWL